MKLAVIGSGYVGLVAGVCLSSTGNDVTLVDVDEDKIRMLREGRVPIYEPGLKEMLVTNTQAGRLSFTTDLAKGVQGSKVIVLAVGTPSAPDGTVDMQYIDAAAEQVARAIGDYTIIVTKSTVPVGTHRRVSEIFAQNTDVPFDYVSNPEFLKEGSAVTDFLTPDRVIIGTHSDRARRILRHLYAPFMRKSDRILEMDPTSAEMTKYACNSMLATRITFVNELAQLCQREGANIDNVRQGMGTDHRIGTEFLFPSIGYGGSCFPKDVKALISMGRSSHNPMRLIEAVDAANQGQREWMFQRIEQFYDGKLTDRRFGVWGLAFKARTDDIRESPAIWLIRQLIGAGATIAAHDPKAVDNAKAALGDRNVSFVDDMYDCLDGSDALIVCTEWSQYRSPDFERIKSRLASPVVFDGRNLYDLNWMDDTGITYLSVGRPDVNRHG